MPDEENNVRPMWSEDELDLALTTLHADQTPDERAFGRARTELLMSAGAKVEPSAEPPRRRTRWWLAAAGTVLAVVASVVVIQNVQLHQTIPSAAGEQLTIAADNITSYDAPLGPGEYRYIATHAWWMATMDKYSYLAENVLETWVPADQTQEWMWRRDVTGARQWVAGTEAQAKADGYDIDAPGWPEGEWKAPCGDWFATEEGREPCSQPASWGIPSAEFLAKLPRDPDELYDRMREDTRGQGPDADLEMVVTAADVLRSGLVPADLRAALYRALAKVPGLQITEEVANLDGRKGTAYGISAKGQRHDVIVDPDTGQFIGEREITEDGFGDVPAGTVMSYTSVSTAVVSGMGVMPAK
jgi:hypothetical protein